MKYGMRSLMRREGLMVLLLALLPVGATAQVTAEQLSVAFTAGGELGDSSRAFVNADDCLTQNREGTLDHTLTVQGSGPSGASKTRLTYSRTGSRCTDAVLEACPKNGAEPIALNGDCACLLEGTGTELQRDFTLRTLWPEACVGSEKTELKFYYEHYEDPDGTGTDEVTATEPIVLLVDLARPPTPSTPPSVSAGDLALKVDVDVVSAEDFKAYEVCVRRVDAVANPDPAVDPVDAGAGSADAGELAMGLDNDALRGPVIRCAELLSGTSTRFDNLEEDVTYYVFYALIDQAGNRGQNSPAATGRPGVVFDFAREYKRYNGGETGGCQVSPSGGGVLALLLLSFLIRRRQERGA